MKNLITVLLLLFLASVVYSGDGLDKLPKLKIKNSLNELILKNNNIDYPEINNNSTPSGILQLKKRKTVSSYIGAGYSFVIFTDNDMNTVYPVFDVSKGEFLTGINLFYGFSIASALTLEFEPSIIYSSLQKSIHFKLKQPKVINGQSYNYAHPQEMSMLAFPLALNARFFPMFKQTSFARLFFIGGGIGAIWIREGYLNYYNNNSAAAYYGDPNFDESTSQWQPLFRVMTGFTGAGGQFGFGGELRYNFIPLEGTNEAFVTRMANNYNSVDLTLRFYFSL